MKGHKVSTFEERLQWLLLHPELWKDLKLDKSRGENSAVPLDQRIKIAQAMKDAKLYAPTTYVLDIRVFKYVIAAQRIQKAGGSDVPNP